MSDTEERGTNQHAQLRIEELLDPAAFPHEVAQLRLVETHISWVLLTGSFAYKIKKPVKLDFIDTSTLELRQHYCNEELRLNRRLAPELYLRVVPITHQNGQVRIDGTGTAIEYAVCLKQFSADAELPALLQRGDVSLPQLLQLAETLAHFHLHTPELSSVQAPQATQRLHDAVLDNLEQLQEYADSHQTIPELRRLWNWTRTAIDIHEEAFEARTRGHRIRDCHGDLHAANVVRFEDRLVAFDCIDFDAQLRCIDVMNDLAFLIMDLYGHAREDLATALLSRYLEITGDYEGVPLLPFYAVYRALVRAKVDAIAADQSPHLADRYTDRLQRRVGTAVEFTERPPPLLLLMHGLSGSGKSWLSEQLVAPLHTLRIRSDVERKRLLGASTATGGFKHGNYAPEMSHKVYAQLAQYAEHCLQAGFNVIVDAAFLDASDRETLTSVAERMLVTHAFISCHADSTTLLDRVANRTERGADASEADQSVVHAQLRNFQPLDREEHQRIIEIDTRDADAVERVVSAVRGFRDRSVAAPESSARGDSNTARSPPGRH